MLVGAPYAKDEAPLGVGEDACSVLCSMGNDHDSAVRNVRMAGGINRRGGSMGDGSKGSDVRANVGPHSIWAGFIMR